MTKRSSGPLDFVSVPVLVLDREGRIREQNRASLDLLGDPSKRGGRSFFALLPRGDPNVKAAAERLSSGGDSPIEIECDTETAGGGTRRMAWTLSPDGQGGVVATGVDVTAWEVELDDVRAHKERLRTVINAMPDPVFLKDGEGRWVEVNPKALEVFGLVGVDYRGRTDLELSEISPFFRDALRWCAVSDEAAWAKGGLSRAEEVLPVVDGPPRTYDTYKLPIFRADGTRKGIVVLGRDISERIWALEALRRSEAQLRMILETAPDAIGLMGPDGKVEFVNTAAEVLYGVPRDQIVGHRFSDPPWNFFGTDGRPVPIDERPFVRAQREGVVRGVEVAFDRSDGRRVILSVNAAALAEPRGAVVFAATDVTRRAEVERMKADFLKIVSHELRTPLTPLRLLIERSKRALASGGAVDPSTLARMERQVEMLVHLMDELLDVARIEAGHFAGAARSEVDLAALVSDVVADFRLHAKASIALEVPSGGATVWANEWALKRVVSNLVDNALKYGGVGVEVKVTVSADRVRVSVRDRGPGIAAEHRANLFDRFYRVSAEATVRQPGLGLGLFISRALIRELGSDVEFESEPGKGATFYFTLPLHGPATAG